MAKKTSITDRSAREFAADATENQQLGCSMIPGFHLIRTKAGASWRYRYTDTLGKRRTVAIGPYPSMSPPSAAEKALEWRLEGTDVLRERKALKKEVAENERQAKERALGVYFEEIYSAFQARKKDGKGTLGTIKVNFSDLFHEDMASLDVKHIKVWQSNKEQQGMAHSTLVRAFGALKTMLNHAVKEGVIESNPLTGMSLEPEPESSRAARLASGNAAKRRMLTGAELKAINGGLEFLVEKRKQERRNSRAHGKPELPDLDGVRYPHWFVPFAMVAMHTGLRPGDIRTLTWQELNLFSKTLNKLPEKTRHHKNPVLIQASLPENLVDLLVPWWEQHDKPQTGFVFTGKNGKSLDKHAYIRHWKTLLEVAGLGDLTFYSLRHNFISSLLAANVPLFEVARLAGHKGIEMIEKHYGHLIPGYGAAALSVIGNRLENEEA